MPSVPHSKSSCSQAGRHLSYNPPKNPDLVSVVTAVVARWRRSCRTWAVKQKVSAERDHQPLPQQLVAACSQNVPYITHCCSISEPIFGLSGNDAGTKRAAQLPPTQQPKWYPPCPISPETHTRPSLRQDQLTSGSNPCWPHAPSLKRRVFPLAEAREALRNSIPDSLPLPMKKLRKGDLRHGHTGPRPPGVWENRRDRSQSVPLVARGEPRSSPALRFLLSSTLASSTLLVDRTSDGISRDRSAGVKLREEEHGWRVPRQF